MSNIILAIDTSINYCSVAIYKKNNVYFISEKCEKKHTSQVLPMIHKLLLQTQTTLKELHYIAFAKGPGNFTSIRIAESIAQSFALSLKIPIIGISTLLIMAEKACRKYKKTEIIVIINAKTTHLYWAAYIKNKKSIWTGEHTESLVKKELVRDKINDLKKKWTIVSHEYQTIEYKKFANINDIKIFFPNARDIIPFVLLKIKTGIILYSAKNGPNYLYNNF
ncbi:tRNA (adenosine(37)-N6)-threonylcarbamoyltransferase complex dimerization subunit type 1 TsaB [Buchnera aphidicola (Brachycaudus cardui)]|uniref:tRNA threonylcarbamoyladenosine biosynthesis protein TsaB n=1 Tax=Buchnera aphidicola (Brachycaudus cardui) TaxID=557993 RepID=A0A4D6XS97_9GAMM|nr:tRNA (adenosine(37)-N6)-threonylcarbamoyltransferase complex dimerization subunit type 1 TsaB [Buchnera aphidicola]QCI20462.1 tRNA (adenosine(37)-N6)-threonylcarbamoyltransferase complex dimerization subunit type 1 TsaB [Buchnera aphidicola (Brachycaudus cardui)]